MNRHRYPLILGILLALAAQASGQTPATQPATRFSYRPGRTEFYFLERVAPKPPSSEASKKLAGLMKAQVVELASKDWGPWQWVSVPVGSFGNRATYYNCPDELLVALAQASPLLDEEGRAAAKAAADREFNLYNPLNFPIKPLKGELRGFSRVSDELIRRESSPGLSAADRKLVTFKTLYGVWAYAEAFDRWETVKPIWGQIKELKKALASSYDFTPKWVKERPAGPGLLTAELAESPEYQHDLLRFMYVGTRGFYENRPPGDEVNNPFVQFGYVKLLSALIGYGRMAEKFGDPAEAAWAKEKFNLVARQMFTYRTAPCYWSSPWLTPEVGRLIRDHASDYLEDLAKLPNVLTRPEKDGQGPSYSMIDPHHWYLTLAGSNGAVPPCSPMSGFLVQAYLFEAPPERLDRWTDIPWCQADYWYIQKCAVAINAYEKAGWAVPK